MMDVKGVAVHALMLLVKSGVISKEEMEEAQKDAINGIPKLLRENSVRLDEKNKNDNTREI